MSENLDLVRSIYADWKRGDFSSADWADPDVKYVTVGGPEPGSSTARDSHSLRDFLSVWDDYRTEAEEYREIDGERILVLARSSGRGKTSGAETTLARANVFHIRGGKVTRAVFYWDRDRAFADLGVAPQKGLRTNLELVRSIYADWERGDFRSEWADADIEFSSADGPDPGRWSGVAAMSETNRDFLGAWRDWHIEAEDVRVLDDERVLVLTRRAGRAKRSGLEISEPAANLFHIRNGKVTRLIFFWDRGRALADLGLASEAGRRE
jgi:ketosteroid isomerase-like protein